MSVEARIRQPVATASCFACDGKKDWPWTLPIAAKLLGGPPGSATPGCFNRVVRLETATAVNLIDPMARIQLPSPDAMTPEQAEVCAEVISGPRGRVPTPMIAWLRNPELARRAQKLGELLRFSTTIEPHLSEMAILVCGRHWTSHVEWAAHKAIALKAGLDPKIIDDIAARRTPVFSEKRAQVIYDVASTLLATGRLSDVLYGRAIEVLGERALAELVAILGYYCLAALTLNAFELGLPGGVAPELDDPAFANAAPST